MRRHILLTSISILYFAAFAPADTLSQMRLAFQAPLSAFQISDVKKDDKPAKAISPADAARKVGEKVTVEMTVASTGGRGNRLFLNSEKNFRDGKNFAIVLDMKKAGDKFKEKKIDDPSKHFEGKV